MRMSLVRNRPSDLRLVGQCLKIVGYKKRANRLNFRHYVRNRNIQRFYLEENLGNALKCYGQRQNLGLQINIRHKDGFGNRGG